MYRPRPSLIHVIKHVNITHTTNNQENHEKMADLKFQRKENLGPWQSRISNNISYYILQFVYFVGDLVHVNTVVVCSFNVLTILTVIHQPELKVILGGGGCFTKNTINTSNLFRCHTSYVTNYDSQQEEECEENFKKVKTFWLNQIFTNIHFENLAGVPHQLRTACLQRDCRDLQNSNCQGAEPG